ncbi:MAG: RagB/SusD family nutrient uptake outer membrane protein [Rikenellaceae bacterium]
MKTRIYLSLICGLVFGFTSCVTDLNPEPATSVSDAEMFSSLDYAETVLNGAHALAGEYTNHTLAFIMADLMGEDALCTTGNRGFSTYNWQMYSYMYEQIATTAAGWWAGYSNYIWEYQYAALDSVNSIITYCPENLPESDDLTELLAQSRGLRGYLFLQLTRLFAPAYNYSPDAQAIVLRTTPADATAEHLGRCTVAEAYAQIIDDLTYAVENITNTSKDYMTSKGCALLLARAYLDMSDYTNAAKYADIAASSTYDGSNLMSQEQYRAGFLVTGTYDETLWYQNYTSTTSNIYASIPSFYYLAKEDTAITYGEKSDITKYTAGSDDYVDELQGYSTLRFSFDFVSKFEATDCRMLFPFYFYEDDGYFTAKLAHDMDSGTLGVCQFPMARIAEAYLIKAECELLGSGDATAAAATLNALQTTRGATATEATAETIDLERRKELYCEGHRLYDIKRQGLELNRVGDEHWASVTYLPANSNRFMLPIPENEINYNDAISQSDQNEYWR